MDDPNEIAISADEIDFTSAADFACDILTKLDFPFSLQDEIDFTYDEIGRGKLYCHRNSHFRREQVESASFFSFHGRTLCAFGADDHD